MPWLPYVWVLSLHLSADRHFVMGGGDLPTEVADERCIPRAPAKKTHSLRFYLLLEDSHNPEFRRRHLRSHDPHDGRNVGTVGSRKVDEQDYSRMMERYM